MRPQGDEDREHVPDELAVWEFAGLMLTYWCSARCAFCYVSSGPEHGRGPEMGVDQAIRLWRGLDKLAARQAKTMRIHLAGGEPFGDWVRLAAVVRAARDAGLTRLEKVETNASWAVQDGVVRARLELLDALGMEKLVVSSDVFHQEYIPFERVQRCVEIARQVLGKGRVIVRWWDFYNEPVIVRGWSPPEKSRAYRQALEGHRDRMSGRAAARLAPLLTCRPAEAYRGENCVRAVLRSRHVHIDPYGNVFPGTCGGIILGRIPLAETPAAGGLESAAAEETAVERVWRDVADNWREHPVVSAVVAGGSYELMQRVKPLGYVERPEGYADKCHLCSHVRQWLVERGLWREYVGPSECYDEGPPACESTSVTSVGESCDNSLMTR